jgi:hypothetical protein
MSLNDIQLNNHLIAQLYEHTLLDMAEKPTPAPAAGKKQQTPGKHIEAQTAASEVGVLTPTALNTPAAPLPAPANNEPQATVAAPVAEYGNTPLLGGNKKGVLILVSSDKAPFLPDAELEFLTTILGACKLSIADVAIVNLQRYPQAYTELVKQFHCRQVLLFGVTPQQIDLPFHFPHFQLQNFDQRTYLSSFPLGAIAQDRELKTQLWGCLKSMFGL